MQPCRGPDSDPDPDSGEEQRSRGAARRRGNVFSLSAFLPFVFFVVFSFAANAIFPLDFVLAIGREHLGSWQRTSPSLFF